MKKRVFSILGIILLNLIFWVLVFFVGSFISSLVIYPLVSIAFIVLFFLLFWKKFKVLILVLSFISFFVIGYTVVNSIKEDYCWRSADKTAMKDLFHYDLSQSEKDFTGSSSISSISDWFRIHLKCDSELTLPHTLKNAYFHW